jgi:hypothetical protein
MKERIKEIIQLNEKEKKVLELIRDEKNLFNCENIELFNENWTSNTMEMIFYHIEIEKYSAKIAVLNELLNEKK